MPNPVIQNHFWQTSPHIPNGRNFMAGRGWRNGGANVV